MNLQEVLKILESMASHGGKPSPTAVAEMRDCVRAELERPCRHCYWLRCAEKVDIRDNCPPKECESKLEYARPKNEREEA